MGEAAARRPTATSPQAISTPLPRTSYKQRPPKKKFVFFGDFSARRGPSPARKAPAASVVRARTGLVLQPLIAQ